mmetsp:Transcript_4743/g.7151  ORF Transcript_4743/g.7151 Transcript_4743/m.7151 type:complete len:254 (+) Transcript_4743:512-1273(+)
MNIAVLHLLPEIHLHNLTFTEFEQAHNLYASLLRVLNSAHGLDAELLGDFAAVSCVLQFSRDSQALTNARLQVRQQFSPAPWSSVIQEAGEVSVHFTDMIHRLGMRDLLDDDRVASQALAEADLLNHFVVVGLLLSELPGVGIFRESEFIHFLLDGQHGEARHLEISTSSTINTSISLVEMAADLRRTLALLFLLNFGAEAIMMSEGVSLGCSVVLARLWDRTEPPCYLDNFDLVQLKVAEGQGQSHQSCRQT